MSSGPSVPQTFQYPNQPQAAGSAFGGATSIVGGGRNIGGAYGSGTDNLGATALAGTSQSLLPNVQTALNASAFNPNLYAQQFQQQQDQTNAALSSQGTAGTPYGAGIAAQQNQNFNNTFNQNQVGLENTAANTAGSLLGSAGSGLATGTGVGQSVATLPYSTMQPGIQDLLSYLQGGTGASQVGGNLALGQQQINNQALGGLGSLLGTGVLGASLFA